MPYLGGNMFCTTGPWASKRAVMTFCNFVNKTVTRHISLKPALYFWITQKTSNQSEERLRAFSLLIGWHQPAVTRAPERSWERTYISRWSSYLQIDQHRRRIKYGALPDNFPTCFEPLSLFCSFLTPSLLPKDLLMASTNRRNHYNLYCFTVLVVRVDNCTLCTESQSNKPMAAQRMILVSIYGSSNTLPSRNQFCCGNKIPFIWFSRIFCNNYPQVSPFSCCVNLFAWESCCVNGGICGCSRLAGSVLCFWFWWRHQDQDVIAGGDRISGPEGSTHCKNSQHNRSSSRDTIVTDAVVVCNLFSFCSSFVVTLVKLFSESAARLCLCHVFS